MTGFGKLLMRLKILVYCLKKELFIICIVTVVLIIIRLGVIFGTTDIFYYQNKHNNVPLQERRRIKPLEFESSLQALVRLYINGGLNYNAKIPFSTESQVLGIYHDREMKHLVLNWNSFFVRDLQSSSIDIDMQLLFKTLKENTSVEMVYFLVEGGFSGLYWNSILLDKGVNLENEY